MTQAVIVKETTEPFWTRVRVALGALRPVRKERVPAYGQAAIARTIGLKPRLGARIEEELAAGWGNAAARRVSLSLLVIEIDRMADFFAAYGKIEADDTVMSVMRTVTEALPRSGDTCLRLGRATFVIVLSDQPMLMARANAAKIAEAVRQLNLPHKESHAGVVTVSMGLAVGNPQGAYDKRFFETAAEALKKAQRKGLGRVEAIDLRPAQERQRLRRAA